MPAGSLTAGSEARRIAGVYRRHLSVGRARLAALTGGALEVSSAGSRVCDGDGVEYLDCGGYGVFILGHCHPRVVDAVIAQVARHPLSSRLLLDPVAAEAAETLASVAPGDLQRVHFVTSGAEAVEAAIKLARANGCLTLVSAHGGYHGKTTGALSLTQSELYQAPFRPLLPEVRHVAYGDAAALDALLATLPQRACVVLEPVQGEAGVVIPPAGYLRDAAQICRAHGALLVLDEVQTGLGRLGTWWGADAEGVVPDMLLAGKNLSGGVIPVAALLATEEVYRPFSVDPYLHTSTFAAAPVAMAAATAAVQTLRDERLVRRAGRLGSELLEQLRARFGAVAPGLEVDIRGRGLLIGLEFADAARAGGFLLELLQRRVLANHSLNAPSVVRLTPPAVLSGADVDWLLTACADAGRALLDQEVQACSG